MGQHVAFLRAVNVGKRTVAMPRLKAMVEEVGFEDVWTYINSGNVVFSGTGSRSVLEDQLEARFEAELGFVVETFVRTAAEVRAIGEARPFTEPAGHTHMVTFLRDRATPAQAAALEGLTNAVDT